MRIVIDMPVVRITFITRIDQGNRGVVFFSDQGDKHFLTTAFSFAIGPITVVCDRHDKREEKR